jgi:curved DNA-binding protein CbpA
MHNYYLDLGLENWPAPIEAVSRAYRRALRTAHPDGGGSAEQLRRVRAAWAVLAQADTKADYDALLTRETGAPGRDRNVELTAPTSDADTAIRTISEWRWQA